MDYYDPHINSGKHGTYIIAAPNEANIFTPTGDTVIVAKNNRALHGDIVYYNIDDIGQATVTGIQKRIKKSIPGVLITLKTKIICFNKRRMAIYEFVPVDWRYPKFHVASKCKSGDENSYILIQFKEWTEKQRNPQGICLDILGPLANPDTETHVALYKNELYFRSHKKDQRFQYLFKQSFTEDGRVDMTACKVFSIDPPGCKDIDDAIHIEPTATGPINVFVHIADVDNCFPSDNFYETEIRKRLSSIYTTDRVYSMIPETFSANQCSLREKKKRNVVSLKISFSSDGTIINREFMLACITNKKAFTYDQADELIGTSGVDYYGIKQLVDLLNVTDTHKLVEKLMIITNQYAAEFIDNRFSRVQKSSGKKTVVPSEILNYVQFKEENGAEYVVLGNKDGHGHDLLGLRNYTHFTSPIRRYADLIVHRLVKNKLLGIDTDYTDKTLCVIAKELNDHNRRLKRFYRDQGILKTYKALNNESDGTINTTGFLVDYKQEYVHIYIPTYDMEYKYRICSRKIIEAGTLIIEWDGNQLSIQKGDHQLIIDKYQELDIALTTDNGALRFQYKIKMRISGIQDFLT